MDYDDALFRKQVPAFADETKYPPEMVQVYWDIACFFIEDTSSPCHMLQGAQLQYALNLMTAHLMSLALAAAEDDGGVPGSGGGGPITSASIGEVSVTRMQPPAADGWQYWLSGTPFGSALWALLGAISAGGFSVGGLPERTGFRKIGGVFT